MCRELSKNKACNWGKCKDCGVVPFLFKLHKGVLVENTREVTDLKEKILGEKLRASRIEILGKFLTNNRRSEAVMHVCLGTELEETEIPSDPEEEIENY